MFLLHRAVGCVDPLGIFIIKQWKASVSYNEACCFVCLHFFCEMNCLWWLNRSFWKRKAINRFFVHTQVVLIQPIGKNSVWFRDCTRNCSILVWPYDTEPLHVVLHLTFRNKCNFVYRSLLAISYDLQVKYVWTSERFVRTVCMCRIRWSCEGLTSVHNEYTGYTLKHLLLRHMYNLSLPKLCATLLADPLLPTPILEHDWLSHCTVWRLI